MAITTTEWLTRKEAAQYTRTTEKTLATLAYQGRGPKFSKPSTHKTLYRRSDLDAWITGEDAKWTTEPRHLVSN